MIHLKKIFKNNVFTICRNKPINFSFTTYKDTNEPIKMIFNFSQLTESFPHLKEDVLDNFKRADQLYHAGVLFEEGYNTVASNKEEAVKLYKMSAKVGNCQAMEKLGYLYCFYEKKYSEGILYLKEAGEQGYLPAIYQLANIYIKGIPGIPKQPLKGLEYLKIACEKNYVDAQRLMGSLYLEGEILDLDIKQAVKHFQLAADQDCSKCQVMLALLLIENFKDYEKGIEYLSKAVEKKDNDAYYLVGKYNESGIESVIRANNDKAKIFYELAAESNHSEAQYKLGLFYLKGFGGCKVDFVRAFSLFEKASTKKNNKALYELGLMYFLGKGIKQDKEKGIKLIKKSSKLGNLDASFFFAVYYFDGNGNEQEKNLSKSIEILESLANKNHIESIDFIKRIYEDKGNYSKSLEFISKLISLKQSTGYYYLGSYYLNGVGVAQDLNKAIDYLSKASTKFNVNAIEILGKIYHHGLYNVNQDYAKAKELFLQGAAKNSVICYQYLGEIYSNGLGVEKDFSLSEKYFLRAIESQDIYSLYLLAELYYNNLQDFKKAVNYYLLALNNGQKEAAYKLGLCYQLGKGVEKDIIDTVRYFRMGIKMGDVQCKYELGILHMKGEGVEKDPIKGTYLIEMAINEGYKPCKRFILNELI